ncbi:hypothetical protein KIW84_066101 [Lathyrus oleraceus]|uniref:RRM domain-containing protein n=1 Tax=Pisum sativum TaxID=3888 RepID=A0A9D5AAN4_PEA|nr:hypothetical protein KIW84_066101 [Pisum sativum]
MLANSWIKVTPTKTPMLRPASSRQDCCCLISDSRNNPKWRLRLCVHGKNQHEGPYSRLLNCVELFVYTGVVALKIHQPVEKRSGQLKGYGFVQFDSEDAAQEAMTSYSNPLHVQVTA